MNQTKRTIAQLQMRRLVRWYILPLSIAALCVLSIVAIYPAVRTIYHLEVGGRALEEAEAFRDAHPHEPNPALDRALRHFQRAVEISPGDGFAYRRLGQAWLLAGNNEAARDALLRATELRPDNPLFHVELGYAYDGLGQVDEALAAYERGRIGPAKEAAIVNYIKVADWQAGAGAADYALEILREKVLVLDPNNLPALYRMMNIYQKISEEAAAQFAAPLRERLRNVDTAQVTLPDEPRLAAYVQETVAALVEEGIWTPEQAAGIVEP